MCWNTLRNNCSQLIDSYLFKESKPLNRKLLIQLTADEFPEIPRLRIAFAVDKYLESQPQPITSSGFVHYMQHYLR
ncbi:MAG TPA: hypothetical protein PK218_07610 [Flavobacterium sp.]|nr:hypothetical protein [Flavobacterium sp.]